MFFISIISVVQMNLLLWQYIQYAIVDAYTGLNQQSLSFLPMNINAPFDIVIDDTETNMYISDIDGKRILKCPMVTEVCTSVLTNMNFSPFGLALDSASNVIYIADYNGKRIMRYSLISNQLQVWAGSGLSGSSDAIGTSASFKAPMFLAIDKTGDLFVSDEASNSIRKITTSNRLVTTVIENDGTLRSPGGLDFDNDGNMVIADRSRCRVIKWTAAGQIEVIAGGNPNPDVVDDYGTFAAFGDPYGIKVGKNGDIYVTEVLMQKIRKIETRNKNYVTTLTWTADVYIPSGIALAENDNYATVYFANRGMGAISRIIPCPPNARSAPGTNFCKCVEPYFQQGYECITCPDGEYLAHDYGRKFCDKCPPGTQTAPDRMSCTICPDGKFRSSLSNNPFCVDCVPNSKCSPVSFVCLAGYSINEANTECVKCSSGYFKKHEGNFQCDLCPLGSESNNATNGCNQCADGFFRPYNNLPSCIPCPRNSICSPTVFKCKSGYQLSGNQLECIQITSTMQSSTETLRRTFSLEKSSTSSITSAIKQQQTIVKQKQSDSIVLLEKSLITSQDFVSAFLSTGAFLIMAVGACIACFYIRKMKLKLQNDQQDTKDYRRDSSSVFFTHVSPDVRSQTILTSLQNTQLQPRTSSKTHLTSSSIISNATSLGNTTLFEKAGVCVPGFLQFEEDKDFVAAAKKEYQESGAFAVVSLAKPLNIALSKYGNLLIVKKMKDLKDPSAEALFYQEVAIMYLLKDHKNVAKFLGYSTRPYSILLKYYPKGNLAQFLYVFTKTKTKRMQVRFSKNICKALEYLHGKGIAHCDLKPVNILLDEESGTKQLFCVLTDFGIARFVNDSSLNVKSFEIMLLNAASIAYASPECMVSFQPSISPNYPFSYDPSLSDTYSFAVNLHEILTRKPLWTTK